jgi:hypothetical protein
VDDRTKITPPLAGVSDGTPRIDQPGLVTVPDGLRNVVPEDSPTGINRLSTRDKLASEFSGAANTGMVQALGSIARASGASGTVVRDIHTDTDGSSRPSGAFKGQCVVLDTDGSVLSLFHDTRGTGLANPPTGAGGYGAFYTCWHPTDNDVGYFATIAADTAVSTPNKIVVGINRVNAATGAITHQTYAIDADAPYSPPSIGTLDLFPNQMTAFGPYLFIAVNKYVYVYRSSDLVYIERFSVPWAEEVQGVQAVSSGGNDFLMVLVTGNYTVTMAVLADGGAPPNERFGEFYRSSILKLRINYADTAGNPVAVGASSLTHVYLPQGTQSGDGGYENHVTFRPSEWSISRPRGCLPYAFAMEVTTDGVVAAYIARTNQGFGYDGSQTNQRPDGQAPYITACRAVLTRGFEAGAPVYMSPSAPVRYGFSEDVGGWERDTGQSLRRSFAWGANTYLNDIPAISGGTRNPHSTDNEPSVWAVAVDTSNRRVVFAGRRPSLSAAGSNVYCFDADNGDLLWELDTDGIIQQNAIAIDPTTGNVLVGMERSAGWEMPDGTTSPTKAEMLTIDGATGLVLRNFDLTDAINFNGYVNSGSTIGVYSVAVNAAGRAILALSPCRFDT